MASNSFDSVGFLVEALFLNRVDRVSDSPWPGLDKLNALPGGRYQPSNVQEDIDYPI